MASLWTLCLTSSQGRKIVKMAPTATLSELQRVASEAYSLHDDNDSSQPSQTIHLKYGFPPKPFTAISSSTTTLSDVLQNQERIQVEFGSTELKKKKTQKKATSSNNHKETNAKTKAVVAQPEEETATPSTASITRKSKRAAAQRATENMPAVIQAQEDAMMQSSSAAKGTNKRPRSSVNNIKIQSKKTPRPITFASTVGEGRRLADGAAVAARHKARKKASSPSLMPNQKSDMSEALLGALQDSGKMGRVLRKGMKSAVQTSYETTRTYSRLAALQSKSYEITNHDPNQFQIQYQGSVDKTRQEDIVEVIPRDVLKEVLQGIHASHSEALRPENVARLSPRVFWNLVVSYPQFDNINDMYRGFLPDLDWSFLRRRAVQLSEKAVENLRQQEQENEQEDEQQALQAIEAVEQAMDHWQMSSAAERQARQAQAALQRLQGIDNINRDEWRLVTPNEPDRDELGACIQTTTQRHVGKLITKLMRECQIVNWRVLALVKDVSKLAAQMECSAADVQKWIDHAQQESVDEIMVEICDNNVTAVQWLIEGARSGTPKDLAAWRSIPQLLRQRLLTATNANVETEMLPTAEQLRSWSQRAHQLLQEYEWLNWYATPVE